MALGWYVSLLWGLIYAQDVSVNRGINGVWTGTGIRLFAVVAGGGGPNISLSSPKGAIDAIGDSIARRVGSLGFGGGAGPGGQPSSREV